MESISTGSHAPAEAWNIQLKAKAGYEDPGIRGQLLEWISKGVDEVYKSARSPKKRPIIAVPFSPLEADWARFEGRIVYSHALDTIFVTRTCLDKLSALPTVGEIDIFKDDTKEAYLQGTLEHVVVLMGVEEGDHSLYWNEQPPNQNREGENHGTSLAEYDSQPIEFRSLERQLEIAMNLGMPDSTLQILRERAINARRIMEALS